MWHKNNNPKLKKNEIDLWLISTNDYLDNLDNFFIILSEDEKLRANRFYFEKDKNNFIITRGILRILLGKYIVQDSNKVVFKYNDYGKPIILNNNIQFNLSHSKNLVLYGFSKNLKLGVDIEFMREKVSYNNIAERFFSDYERQSLNSIPEPLQKEAFFNGWTRKEAYIKLKEKGLSIPLDSFDVSIIPEERPLLIDSRDDDIHFSNWKLFDIKTFKEYKAALITDKSVASVNHYTFWR